MNGGGDMDSAKEILITDKSVLDDDDPVSVHVERPIYQQDELNRETLYSKPTVTLKTACKKKVKSIRPLSCLFDTIPVLKWLPKYKWKKNFVKDLISGITVAIMHIPQGMAYGLLGNVPPVVGIYMAFFPVLIYFIFGTSRHVSMGTFAIVCLMTGKVVSQHSTTEIMQNGTIRSIYPENEDQYTNLQVATTVTFAVAIFEMIMYVFRLGILSTLLSETLVDGFICASAFHVVSSQLKDLLGLAVPRRRGLFRFPYTMYDALIALPSANRAAVTISMISCVALSLNNELFKPWLAKKTTFPLPIELVAVIFGTTASYFVDFQNRFNVSVVGYLPTGLPEPQLPSFSLLPYILPDAFVIAMVSYSVTMSMALIFAQKAHYEVNSNQELLAQGISNCFGSFFSCMPITASLSRSMIQFSVGGVTQLASIVSCLILLCILLWIGPFFEYLPRCVLASIIVIALQGMVMKVTMIKKYWNLSKWDSLVWIVTFFTTVVVDISIGLGAGAAVSLFSLFVQGYTPYTCLLGVVPNTDLYLDIKRYKGTQEIPGIKIFHYSGGLSFASKASFKELLFRKVGFEPHSLLRKRLQLEESQTSTSESGELLIRCVILDFSSLTYVDPSGVEVLRQLKAVYEELGIGFYIAGCSGPVFETFKKCDKYQGKESKFMILPTVHDAVLYAQANLFHAKNGNVINNKIE